MNFGFLRFMALLEGTSLLLLLFVAIGMKRMMGMEVQGVISILGPVHGGLFVFFNVLLLYHVIKRNLTAVRAFIGFIASLIPFGTFVYKAKILK